LSIGVFSGGRPELGHLGELVCPAFENRDARVERLADAALALVRIGALDFDDRRSGGSG